MKLSKAEVRGKATLGMELRFETQNLTSYSGLVLFQHFFSLIGIKERLWRCFRHLKANPIYAHHVMVMLLVVHLIIGHRRLRDLDYYRDDELVKRVLGLKRLPHVSTVSRSLRSADERSVGNVRAESTTMVIERLVAEGLASVTLDFDKSVLSTGRHAEGTAVGFNKNKKGARSYVSGHYEPWLRDRAQCGGGSWLCGPRSERRGSSANSDFHLRGVSSMARLAGCMLMRWSTSIR